MFKHQTGRARHAVQRCPAPRGYDLVSRAPYDIGFGAAVATIRGTLRALAKTAGEVKMV